MPLTQITVRKGRSEAHKRALADGVYEVMRKVFAVPEGDRFVTILEFGSAEFSFGHTYGGVERSDDLTIVQITVSNNRTREQKLALYREIAFELGERAGCRPDDILINIVEVLPENWSFGQGRAQNLE